MIYGWLREVLSTKPMLSFSTSAYRNDCKEKAVGNLVIDNFYSSVARTKKACISQSSMDITTRRLKGADIEQTTRLINNCVDPGEGLARTQHKLAHFVTRA